MKDRWKTARSTLMALWRMAPKALRVIIILFTVGGVLIIATSPEPLAWVLPCLLMLVVGLAAGAVVYQLLFKDHP